MRKSILFFSAILFCLTNSAQSDNKLTIISITPSENTGQDYSSWLNDDLYNLVPNCWNASNFKYVDVTLQLESKSIINKLSFYDYEGIFTENPASVYALNGHQKTLIGTFTGEKYKEFVDLIPGTPLIVDAIIIHKYCNNIPQKVEIYGFAYVEDNIPDSSNAKTLSVITFDEIPNKTEGDSAFILKAGSTNSEIPVTFISSNPAVVSVHFSNGIWIGTILSAGTATITAAQAGNTKFSAAEEVVRTINILSKGLEMNVKIPIDPERWFQLTNAGTGLGGLFDGKKDAEVHTGWGKIIENYDSYYPVLNGEQIDLSGIRMYDGQGNNTTQPMTLSIISKEGQRITVATFTGKEYNSWVGPQNDPGKFNLQPTFKDIKYLVINSWNFFPTEIEYYGNYTTGNLLPEETIKHYPLKQMFGVNGFEWNFSAPKIPGQIDIQSFAAAKTFTGFRHYMDWEKLESVQGNYSFNPTISGGWNYDAIYDSCKAAGIEVVACLKTLPGWMLNSYPVEQRDWENVPVKYGKDFTDPLSYIEQAKVAFQYAARYGSNKMVDRSLLTVNSTPRWTGDHVNTIKVGLGTVNYIECENERDKWWKGRKAYQTAYEYAANLSAFYDGNKNTMGPGVGIKNADPNMKVVMAGTALATTDYLKGMVDWCRRYRGYNADGSVNLCWDVINYHLYSNDSRTSQNGNATRGAAPEISGAVEVAKEFILAAHKYANDMPVWVTELGYDINQGSPFKAIPIGDKTALETQADWILRSSLLYARSGVERIFFYGMYDDNVSNPLQFSSSGLINADKTRKPAADYIYQVNKLFGEYTYKETINKDPIVENYHLDGNPLYVIVVPDEKGRTKKYTLDLGNFASAKIFTPVIGSDNMNMKIVVIVDGKLTITATETPVFIVPVTDETNSLLRKKQSFSGVTISDTLDTQKKELLSSIKIYPNPASDFIEVILNSKNHAVVTLRILHAGSGRVYKKMKFDKPGDHVYNKINIHSLPAGYYVIEIKQGNNRVVKKILKTNGNSPSNLN